MAAAQSVRGVGTGRTGDESLVRRNRTVNLLTGIADAHLDRAPMVAITGQASSDKLHKEAHQVVDIVRMLEPVTKWNARIHDPEIIPEAVRKAFAVAEREKPGATHLELEAGRGERRLAGQERRARIAIFFVLLHRMPPVLSRSRIL